MIERLLENWLTKTNERGYMIPYCQLLLSKGYKLLYISPHGMLEEGKDIIALNGQGKPEAFQLKNGDINLAQWRLIQGEINELVTIPIQHASVAEKSEFKTWLVTNGEVKDPVRTQILTLNRNNWGQQVDKKLEYQDKGILLADFLKYYGHFFPSEPADFKLFLELHLEDGTDMFPKEKYLKYIEPHLQIDSNELKPTKASSLISSAVILTSYILTPWLDKNNYVAQIEAWLCLISTIFATVTKFNIEPKFYSPSLEIIQLAIDECFEKLLEEVKNRNHLIEGDWRTDTVLYDTRVTIVLGYLCAYALYKKLQGKPLSTEKEIVDICQKYEPKMKFNGEAYSPLLIYYFWLNELNKRPETGNRISSLIIGLTNPKKYPTIFGWPNPYYTYEYSFRLNCGFITKEHTDSFTGQSYSLKALLGIIVRRNGKEFIEEHWRKISHIQFAEFVPNPIWETFLWRARNGVHETRFPNQTQSWKQLYEEAFSNEFVKMPDLLKKHPEILLLFVLIYPHRLTEENIRFLDLIFNLNLKK